MIERKFRLLACSVALSDLSCALATNGNLPRAMRALVLADALQHAANGDKVGKRLALAEAKSLRRAEQRGQMVPSE